MSETSLPNPARLPRTQEGPGVRSRDESPLKVAAIRGEIAAQRRVERLMGEVTRVMPDGTVTIRTDKGEVDVKPRPNAQQPSLQPGQTVEVEIPPGRPPRQVIVRPAPEAQKPNTPEPPRPAPADPQRPPAADTSQPRPAPQPPSQPAPPPLPAQPPVMDDGGTAPAPDMQTPRPSLPEQIQALIPSKIQAKIQTALSELGLMPRSPIPGGGVEQVAPAVLRPDTIVRIRLYNPGTDGPPTPVPAQPATTLPLPPAQQILAPAPQMDDNGQPVRMTGPATQIQTPAPNPAMHILPALITGMDFPLRPETPEPGNPSPAMTAATAQTTLDSPDNLLIKPSPLVFSASSPIIDARILRITTDSTARLMAPDIAITRPLQPERPDTAAMQDPRIPATAQRAVVVGMTMQSFPLVTMIPSPLLSTLPPPGSSPDIFLMQYPALNLPVGAEMILQPITGALPQPAQGPVATLPTAPFDLMRGWAWPAFDDATDLLQQIQTQQSIASSNAATLPLPTPAQPGKVPAALLFFMAAVRAGDMAGWMGDRALNILRRDSTTRAGDILSKIGRDFSGLTRMADQPVSQDWKAMAFPMFYQGEITKLNLFYRHQDAQKQQDKDSPDNKSTRFIFDLHLNQMGDIQLDGLMKSKRLDMVVRSEQAFSPTMQQEMRRAYHTALDSGGLHGDLLFQNRRDQFVRVEIKPTEIGLSA